jgi:hypothetical protein
VWASAESCEGLTGPEDLQARKSHVVKITPRTAGRKPLLLMVQASSRGGGSRLPPEQVRRKRDCSVWKVPYAEGMSPRLWYHWRPPWRLCTMRKSSSFVAQEEIEYEYANFKQCS